MSQSPIEYVDTHFHIWDVKKFVYQWPESDMVIHRSYNPGDLWKDMKVTPIKHAVFVQVFNNEALEETKWVLEETAKHKFIKGIVASLDLTSPKLEEMITSLKPCGLIKGVRHILDVEKEDWITQDDVNNGLSILEKHGLTYDLLVRPHHLKYVPSVVSKHPNLKFIIDHIAKPYIKDGIIDGWKEDIAEIAKYPNVHCKLSGLVNEADPDNWKPADFQKYVDHVLKIFTADRCMFGSDWPVFTMAHAKYKDIYNLLQTCLSSVSEADKLKIFRENAIKFYNLKVDS